MAQFNATLRNNSQYRLELVVNQGSQSISNNTSNVTWALRVRKTSGSNYGGYWASGTFNWSVNIGGVSRSGSISGYDFRNYTVLNLGSGTETIKHNSDGRKFINVSGTWTGASTLGSATASGSLNLKTIPRASSFSLGGSTETGSAVSVSISRASSSFTHRVRWRIGSGSWTTVTSSASTSTSFTVPHSAIPNASSATITVAVQTYNGSTSIGSEQSRTRKLSVPSSIVPDFSSISHSETVSLIKNAIGEYVQNRSKINFSINGATAGNGASIKSYQIKVANQTINARTGTTKEINAKGSVQVIGTVTDSRGRSKSKSINVNVLSYQPPTLASYSVNRTDSSGNLDFFNTHATVQFKTNVSSLNGKNKATYQVRSKELPDGFYTNISDDTSVGINENVIKTYSGYQRTLEYQFEIIIADLISTTTITTDQLFLPTAGVPFIVGHGGTASAFGKIPTFENEYDLEIGNKGMRSDGQIIDERGIEVIGLGGKVVDI